MKKSSIIATALACLAAGFAAGMFVTGISSAKENVDVPEADRAGYLIVLGKDYDLEKLRTYSAALPPIYEKHQGGYLAIDTDYTMLEGTLDSQSIVVAKFPSKHAVLDFWASPEYEAAKKLREGNGEFTVLVVEGLPTRL
jgi:uncharacterized protein (DUF1330 family)